MNTKGKEARFVADALMRAGVTPWIVDLSLKAHTVGDADLAGANVAAAAGVSWQMLNECTRQDAAAVMIDGGTKLLLDKFFKGDIAGAIGLGGANGTNLVCSIFRAMPYLVPKVMISTVAGTAAVQWYVAESDIAMYPSIGDVSLNRITKSVMENAALAVAAAVKNRAAKKNDNTNKVPLVAVSSFGGTAACVDRVTERLEALGYEVILFHASGVGGKSLERLAASGELSGVVDVTTHELADLIVDGVFSAGNERLTGAGAAGLPQVIVPGAIDHANFWVGHVPECYRKREFFQYNAQNLLMRTEALAEYERIEHEDVATMRLDDKTRNSDNVRGEELESALSVRNLALLGRILATACLKRTESRGAHFQLDYPETDDVRWRVVTRVQLGANDALEFYTDPVKEPAIASARSETVATK